MKLLSGRSPVRFQMQAKTTVSIGQKFPLEKRWPPPLCIREILPLVLVLKICSVFKSSGDRFKIGENLIGLEHERS